MDGMTIESKVLTLKYMKGQGSVEDLKIFKVTFNDGDWWHTEKLPSKTVVAKNESEAEIVARSMYKYDFYKNWCCQVTEIKVDGYEIIIKKM